MGERSTPSRRRSGKTYALSRLVRALASELAPLRSLIPRESSGFSRRSVARWSAWNGEVCPLCGSFSPVLFPEETVGTAACPDCPADPAFDAVRSLFPYREEVQEAIRGAKYAHVPLATGAVADRLLQAIRSEWADLFPDRFRPVIVPVPIRPGKYFRRGFNLPAQIGVRLARRTRWSFDPLLLRRIRESAPQAGLPLVLRADNIRGSFAASAGRRIPQEILLLDDVYTSGATAGECARALKRAGAENIVVVTVARAVL